MLWVGLLLPLVALALRREAFATKRTWLRPTVALVARCGVGLLWFGSAHEILRSAGDAMASAVLKDLPGAFVNAAFASASIILFVLTTWAWSKRSPRALDALCPAATVLLCIAVTLPSARLTGRPPARFGRVLALQPSSVVEDTTPNRPFVRATVNDRGFRGPTWLDAKAQGTIRGVLIGDSFVFGSGVELNDTLAESLRQTLAARAPGQAYEIINLGIVGDNLPSHLDVYEEAARRLDPDFVVLCLTLPNDLSEYDDQIVRREEREIGALTVVRWAMGSRFAALAWAWTVERVATEFTPEALAVLDRGVERLTNDRSTGTPPPLLVFTYRDPGQTIRAPIERVPGTTWVTPPREEPAFFIPLDGHPTGFGNRAFAARIADAMSTVPALSGPLVRGREP
jgi:hypothetical protein